MPRRVIRFSTEQANLASVFLGRQDPGAEAAADDGLEAEHGRFHVRPPAVADRLLPTYATLVPDHPDVLVALAGCRARGWQPHEGAGALA